MCFICVCASDSSFNLVFGSLYSLSLKKLGKAGEDYKKERQSRSYKNSEFKQNLFRTLQPKFI